jgi:LacI family transcriptional regulator
VKHPYRISEIAVQAGLSQATVDRVLHHRGGVRDSTVRAVQRAVADLDRQSSAVRPPAPVVRIDLVADDAAGLRAALEAELPGLHPTVIRPRFHTAAGPAAVTAALARVGRSRSQGLILRAPDTADDDGRQVIVVVGRCILRRGRQGYGQEIE